VKDLKVAVCLTTKDNDYQREQANAAEATARQLGVKAQIIYGEGDAVAQSQQVLSLIQADASQRPDAIMCEPVGTGLAQVAQSAAAANIGWAILNRDVDYIPDLRRRYKVPVFGLSTDNDQVGRIQGQQATALCPAGGIAFLIQGPAMSTPAQRRMEGFNKTRPTNLQVRAIRGQWTEESAYAAAQSWLRLSTSHQVTVNIVIAQNDEMALGARRAFEDATSGAERQRFLNLPFLGCDGVPATGQAWVRSAQLTATVVIPANTGTAMEMIVRALRTGIQPPEHTYTVAKSFPEAERLTARSATSGAE
jgi:ribose transport system substrate-binding protein